MTQMHSGGGTSGLDLVVEKAAIDAEFRRALLVDPHEAIADAFGVRLPASFRLKFIEKPADVDVVVVLPDLVPEQRQCLEDGDLGKASGGCGAWSLVLRAGRDGRAS